MRLKFWWNAFIEVSIQNKNFVCDPWINEIKEGYGWTPNSKFCIENVFKCIKNAD